MKKHPEASFAMPRVVAIDNLSAFSLLSLAGGIAGVTSGLPLGFQGGFPRCLLGEFRIPSLLLSFQGDLTSGSFGGLCRSQGSSLTCFNG
jgi:hypothetical protein